MACVAEHSYRSGRFGDAAADHPLRPGGLELTRRAAAYAGFAAGQRIVDLGCGEGLGTQLLCHIGCRAVGVDVSPAALAAAVARLPGLLPIAASASRLPIADASCDGIIAECSLSLLAARADALAECLRVLRPGGRLAITDVYARLPVLDATPAPAAPAGPAAAFGSGGLPTRAAICAELTQAGFAVERWEDHSAVLKSFVARVIFAAPEAPDTSCCARDEAWAAALRARRPGYYLLIARRAGEGK